MKYALALLMMPLMANASMRGTYEVPVDDPVLAPYSVYEIDMYSDDEQNFPDAQMLELALPAELVGQAQPFTLKREGDNWHSEDVEHVNCGVDEGYFTCEMKFLPVSVDLRSVATTLAANRPDITNEELRSRLAVSAIFSGEPIGIFRYKLRGKHCKQAY